MTLDEQSAAPKPLSGSTRAAIVLRELGEELAASVLREMEEPSVNKICQALTSVKGVPLDVRAEIMGMFTDDISGPGFGPDSLQFLTKVLTTALGDEQANEILDRIRQVNKKDAFQLPANTDARTLAMQMAHERPQTIALLLAHVPHEFGASVLSFLPEDLAADALFRFSTLDVVSPIAVAELREMLEQTVTANGGISRRVTNLGGPKHAADILNHFPTALSESILGSIKIKDDKTSEKIRENLFTFQDLGKLSDRALQILLREIPGEKLASALRLVEESLRARFYQNLSSRQVEVLKEELRTAPPIRRSDALSAQGEILESALKLASEGKISIGSTDDLI